MSKDKKELPKETKKKVVVVEEVDEVPVENVQEVAAPVESEPISTPVEVSPVQIETPELVVEEEKSNYLWIIIPTALLIGALVGGLITYFSGLSRLKEADVVSTPIATIAPDVQATATPSPKSDFERSVIKLQVLNGSGISGLAGKAKIYLEGLGYKDIVAGNASVSNLIETTISVKDSKKELLDNVIADLSKNYKVAEKTEILPTTSKYDFVITLGSK